MRFFSLQVIVLLTTCMMPSLVQAQHFKIESQIYINGEDQPSSSNTTLFSDGLVFDLQTKGTQSHEVTILNPKQHQTILLDRLRRMKLVLDDLELIKMADALRRETSQDKTAGFLVNERYEETLSLDNGAATIKSPTIEYSIRGSRPKDISIFPVYRNFIDAFTRLQVSDPHAFSPFPRMRLNESIHKLGWVPTEVNVKFESNPLMKDGLKATSKHTLIQELSSGDKEKIAELKLDWLNFESVDLYEFRHLKKLTIGQRMASNRETEPDAQTGVQNERATQIK